MEDKTSVCLDYSSCFLNVFIYPFIIFHSFLLLQKSFINRQYLVWISFCFIFNSNKYLYILQKYFSSLQLPGIFYF